MALLVTKNDLVEVVCKFKGHIIPSKDVQELKENTKKELQSICERCNFSIMIKIDPEDDSYYLVSDSE